MGVSSRLIIMYGIEGNYGDFMSEDVRDEVVSDGGDAIFVPFKNECEISRISDYDYLKSPEPILVEDGMCGCYSKVGVAVDCGFDSRFDRPKEVDFSMTTGNLSILHENFIEAMSKLTDDRWRTYEPKLIIFEHSY